MQIQQSLLSLYLSKRINSSFFNISKEHVLSKKLRSFKKKGFREKRTLCISRLKLRYQFFTVDFQTWSGGERVTEKRIYGI